MRLLEPGLHDSVECHAPWLIGSPVHRVSHRRWRFLGDVSVVGRVPQDPGGETDPPPAFLLHLPGAPCLANHDVLRPTLPEALAAASLERGRLPYIPQAVRGSHTPSQAFSLLIGLQKRKTKTQVSY